MMHVFIALLDVFEKKILQRFCIYGCTDRTETGGFKICFYSSADEYE